MAASDFARALDAARNLARSYRDGSPPTMYAVSAVSGGESATYHETRSDAFSAAIWMAGDIAAPVLIERLTEQGDDLLLTRERIATVTLTIDYHAPEQSDAARRG